MQCQVANPAPTSLNGEDASMLRRVWKACILLAFQQHTLYPHLQTIFNGKNKKTDNYSCEETKQTVNMH